MGKKAHVLLRLLTSREVDVTLVRVNTRDRVVTLNGTLSTGVAHVDVLEDAQRVEGVTTVINHLQLGSEAARHPQGSSGAPRSGSL
jgi:osmotically-inducible protein OsmY